MCELEIEDVLDLLVNEMGWTLTEIARAPSALTTNFLDRLVRRCAVIKALKLKGLVKKDLKLGPFLRLSEADFLDNYVFEYEHQMPQLMDLYHGHVDFEELGLGATFEYWTEYNRG